MTTTTYTWSKLFNILLPHLLTYKNQSNALLSILKELGINLPPAHQDNNIALAAIDPFTFIAAINRFAQKRVDFFMQLAQLWQIPAPNITQIQALPVSAANYYWYYPLNTASQESTIQLLWELFDAALKQDLNEDLFNAVLALPSVGKQKLTQALFWVNPTDFLPIDKHTIAYLQKQGMAQVQFKDFATYTRLLQDIRFSTKLPFPTIVAQAQQWSKQQSKPAYYMLGAFWGNADQSARFLQHQIWEDNAQNIYREQILNFTIGDKVALKQMHKSGTFFIKAIGTVSANPQDGTLVFIDWKACHLSFADTTYQVYKRNVQEIKNPLHIAQIFGIVERSQIDQPTLAQTANILPTISPNIIGENKIFFGCSGTGKSRLVESLCTQMQAEIIRTVFHPESDYASFIGAYKPSMQGNKIIYEFIPQAFLKAYVLAWQNPHKAHVLIIEELNRGNAAAVFGQLFQLLDRDAKGLSYYPILADTEIALYLEKHLGKKHTTLQLPSNLFLYATINTSDQSLYPLDAAFKRRWAWQYIPIDYEDASTQTIILDDNHHYNWGAFLQMVNDKIYALTHNEDKCLGNRFAHAHNNCIDYNTFLHKVLFYLWSEILKFESMHHAAYFFKYSDSHTFTYNDLFRVNAKEILLDFFAFHGIENIKV